MVRRESLLQLVKALDRIHVAAGSEVDNIVIIGNMLDMLRIDVLSTCRCLSFCKISGQVAETGTEMMRPFTLWVNSTPMEGLKPTPLDPQFREQTIPWIHQCFSSLKKKNQSKEARTLSLSLSHTREWPQVNVLLFFSSIISFSPLFFLHSLRPLSCDQEYPRLLCRQGDLWTDRVNIGP